MNVFAKKYFRIYFLVILGLALFIVCTVGIGELMSRLQPDNQVLYVAPEETESTETGLMKIYAQESYWNEDKTVESQRMVEMKIGQPLKIGYMRTAKDETNRTTHQAEDIMYYYADYYAMDIDGGGDFFQVTGDAEFEVSVSDYDLIEVIESSSRERYEMTIFTGLAFDTSTISEYPRAKYDYDIEKFSEIHPGIILPELYRDTWRVKLTHSLFIYAFDLTHPQKLIAKAEIEITYHSNWRSQIEANDYLLYQILYDNNFHLNPDNYGYTTAELVDYWEIEEWE